MNPGLVWLLTHAPRAWVRSLGRKARGPKRILLWLAGGAIVLVILAGQVPLMIANAKNPLTVARDLDTARLLAPLFLTLMLFLVDISGRGLYFRPPEIDFLFPAPVSRRDLLLYQVISRCGISALSGLWSAIFTLRWAGTIVGGLAGAMLGMVFLQLASQVGSLAVAAVGEKAAPRVRMLLWGAVAALAGFGGWTALDGLPRGTPIRETIAAFAESPFIVVATAPMQPFARLFCASCWHDTWMWGLVCLGELALMVGMLFKLDVAFEEAAIASSQKIQERIKRMRSGEGAFLPSAARARKRRIPMLPRLGGAGALGRRQLLELVRNPGPVVWTAGSMLFCITIMVLIGRHESDGEAPTWAALAIAFALTTFANQGFTFDFRRDLDRMAELKMLPLRPTVLAAGQLIAPTVVFTGMQFLAIAIVFAAASPPAWVLAVAVFALPPWNWLSAATDNALFLTFPYRINPEDTGKVPAIGRMLLSMMLKGVAVGAAALIVAVPVGVGFGIGGAAAVAGCVIGWLLLVAMAAAFTFVVGAAFRGFDLSRDA
ncbi:MAG: putative ABC exporter domain-containing protein [Planctomycetes bacterium]|nr:putative ABC exporter domain-containing protein [Planctomycetota bacterium]